VYGGETKLRKQFGTTQNHSELTTVLARIKHRL